MYQKMPAIVTSAPKTAAVKNWIGRPSRNQDNAAIVGMAMRRIIQSRFSARMFARRSAWNFRMAEPPAP